MPFSFKPDVIPAEAQAVSSTPPVAFGASPNNSKTISTENLMERAKEQGKSLVDIIAMGVFGVTALVTAGLFGYKFLLSSQVEAKKTKLASYETQLAGIPIEDMRKLSNRIKVISQLVKEHPSVNVAFLIVEASVENMVTFSKFSLNYSETLKSYQLSLGGVAPDYKSVAQQVDTYKSKPYSTYISKVTVDSLAPNANGQIAVSFTMPVSITGIVPETFTLIDGAAEGVAILNQVTGPQATTSPAESVGKATTTAQVMMPEVVKP